MPKVITVETFIASLKEWGCEFEEYYYSQRDGTGNYSYKYDDYDYTLEVKNDVDPNDTYKDIENVINDSTLLCPFCGTEINGIYEDMMLCHKCNEHI